MGLNFKDYHKLNERQRLDELEKDPIKNASEIEKVTKYTCLMLEIHDIWNSTKTENSERADESEQSHISTVVK